MAPQIAQFTEPGPPEPVTQTRQRFVDAATRAFAERGFYGTSIASIAQALPFTKQALLHHFGSKEKLYGEVLKQISDRLSADLAAVRERYADPAQRLEETFVEFYRRSTERRDDTQLLMRELLDNKRRAETSRTWYLKPFLETLTDMVMDASQGRIDDRHQALAVAYQILGAICYFLVSEPTLNTMFGENAFAKVRGGFERQLRSLIAAQLAAISAS